MHIEQKTNRIFRPIGNTTLSAEETNQVTTEIENQIIAGGLTPNASTLTQLRDSIQNVVDTAANDLQSQIDAITSASDVFDVVGTYAQLQSYDTSTVPVNDIIKVLQDETRQNAMTYYRWNGTTWVFIGAEGPYYTVAETDTKFALKTQLPGIATTQQAGLVKPDGQSVLIGQDGTLSVAQTMSASLPLFTCQFTDHLLNDASYLRADTFSWNSGDVYISAYQHLVDDIAGKTAETETISGITITFYRATDGHKIVLAEQESNVSAIYTATGVAWYYILDTANTRFKLPRMLPLGDTAPVVGNGLSVGWTDGTNNFSTTLGVPGSNSEFANTRTQDFGAYVGDTVNQANLGANKAVGVVTDPTKSGLIANLSHTSNDGAYKYLYFYCGNTVQSQTTIDVGQITETLNSKADLDLSNVSATGKNTAIGWGMPDYDSGITIALATDGVTYTPSFPGVIRVYRANNDGQHYIRVYKGTSSSGIILQEYAGANQYNTGYCYAYIPVSAGETYFIICNTLSVVNAVFFPFKGAN